MRKNRVANSDGRLHLYGIWLDRGYGLAASSGLTNYRNVMNRKQRKNAAKIQRAKLRKRLFRAKDSGDWVETNLVKDKLAAHYRQNPTRCEKKLWNAMGEIAAHEGWCLESQVLITPYIADILIANRKVIVEADGQFHRKAYDERRDKHLLGKGYRTIRISNDLIRADVLAAIEQVKALV